MQQPKSGEPLFIEEILQKMRSYTDVEGMSIKITGKLDDHNVTTCIARVTDPQTGTAISVDTQLIEPFESRKGSLFQFVGELDCLRDTFDVRLKARVVRCVDGLDMTMYKKAIQAQRQYLENRLMS